MAAVCCLEGTGDAVGGGWWWVVVLVMVELEGAERPRRKGDHGQGWCGSSRARTGNFSSSLLRKLRANGGNRLPHHIHTNS